MVLTLHGGYVYLHISLLGIKTLSLLLNHAYCSSLCLAPVFFFAPMLFRTNYRLNLKEYHPTVTG